MPLKVIQPIPFHSAKSYTSGKALHLKNLVHNPKVESKFYSSSTIGIKCCCNYEDFNFGIESASETNHFILFTPQSFKIQNETDCITGRTLPFISPYSY